MPTKAAMLDFVVKQREHRLRPVTVNTHIGAMNAVCVWLHAEGHVPEPIKLAKLGVERRMAHYNQVDPTSASVRASPTCRSRGSRDRTAIRSVRATESSLSQSRQGCTTSIA